RLPTEAEWEYVARSGEKQEIWAGTSDERQLGNYSVYEQNSGGQTDIVGSKQPNDLGFYDMSGNVREWVEDCLHETYEGAPSDGTAWRETGGGYCDLHVARGGSWISEPEDLRTSGRYRVNATIKNDLIGFRLAQDIP
ncbi:MAG: SUMF1/EgtB/PvdO family nonheme iron enzyme, partial [Nitrospira sp.]|nr:SUMF1/EgtB/PvdO family nonheme iron enzyme [Nitrospira sp.]